MTLDQGHDTSYDPGQSTLSVKRYGHENKFSLCVRSDLDPGDIAFSQGHCKPVVHGQQLCVDC